MSLCELNVAAVEISICGDVRKSTYMHFSCGNFVIKSAILKNVSTIVCLHAVMLFFKVVIICI